MSKQNSEAAEGLSGVSQQVSQRVTQKSVSVNIKKGYETPVLAYYGDVRDVTLGPTVGIGESGNELGRRP